MDDVFTERSRYARYALKRSAAFMRPLLELVRDGGIALSIVVPNSAAFFDDRSLWAAIVSDDLGANGPQDFDILMIRHAFECSGLVMIVSAGSEPAPYALVADFIRTTGCNATIVETELSRELVWTAAALAANPYIHVRYYTPAVMGSA